MIFENWIIKKNRYKRINYMKIPKKIMQKEISEEKYALLVIKIYSKNIAIKNNMMLPLV